MATTTFRGVTGEDIRKQSIIDKLRRLSNFAGEVDTTSFTLTTSLDKSAYYYVTNPTNSSSTIDLGLSGENSFDFIDASRVKSNYQLTLIGGGGNNTILGGRGDDVIFGSFAPTSHSAPAAAEGANSIAAGDGNDLIFGGEARILSNFGEEGAITLESLKATIGALAATELSTVTDTSDYLHLASKLKNGNKSPTITPRKPGKLSGGKGNDTIFSASAGDVVYGGDGDDVLISSSKGDTLDGGQGNDLLIGGAGNDYMVGGAGNNTIISGDGNDTVVTGLGNDYIVLGAGNETLYLRLENLSQNLTITIDGNQFSAENLKIFWSTAPNGVLDDLTNITASGGTLTYTLGSNTATIIFKNFTNFDDPSLLYQGFSQRRLLSKALAPTPDINIDDGTLFLGSALNDHFYLTSSAHVASPFTPENFYYRGFFTSSNYYGGFKIDGGLGNNVFDSVTNAPSLAYGSFISYGRISGRNTPYIEVDNINIFNLGDKDDVVFLGLYDLNKNYTINLGGGNNIAEGSKNLCDRYNLGLENRRGVITAGSGNDSIAAGRNGDSINAGDGNNFIFGNVGNDSITVGKDNSTVFGSEGDDFITFGYGKNSVNGDLGSDIFNFSGGSNDIGFSFQLPNGAPISSNPNLEGVTLQSIQGIYNGGKGTDSFFGSSGNDLLINGTYTVTRPSGSTESLTASFINFEYINLGIGNDFAYLANSTGLVIDGGVGDDLIIVTAGANTLRGDWGNDSLIGGEGNVQLDGGEGNDVLATTNGANTLLGGGGNDILIGGRGDDVLDGGTGDDIIYGGDRHGFDTIDGGLGNNTLDGGDGYDILSFASATSGVSAQLGQSSPQQQQQNSMTASGGGHNDVFVNFEGFIGSQFNDTLIGNSIYNSQYDIKVSISGGEGNDYIAAGGARFADLDGGAGDDTIVVGTGNETINGGIGFDMLSFADASNGVRVALAAWDGEPGGVIIGDNLSSYKNFEGIIGSNYDDSITGDWKSNSIYGGAGDDLIYGAYGNDTIDGGDGDDLIVVQQDPLLHGGGSSLFGGAGYDVLIGGNGDDTIVGGADDDNIDGGLGNNSLDGGDGTDLLSFASAGEGVSITFSSTGSVSFNGQVSFYTNFEQISGSIYNDTLIAAGAGCDNLIGDEGNDSLAGGTMFGLSFDIIQDGATITVTQGILDGGDGDDTLRGGSGIGDYLLYGGQGCDTFVFTRDMLSPDGNINEICDFDLSDDTLDLSDFSADWKNYIWTFEPYVDSDGVTGAQINIGSYNSNGSSFSIKFDNINNTYGLKAGLENKLQSLFGADFHFGR